MCTMGSHINEYYVTCYSNNNILHTSKVPLRKPINKNLLDAYPTGFHIMN